MKRVVHVFGQSLLTTLLEERDARGIEDIYLLRVRTVLSIPGQVDDRGA